MKRLEVLGQRFGALIAGRDLPARGKRRVIECRCDCGQTTAVELSNLVHQYTQSCGCLHKRITSVRSRTHGLTRTPIYVIWRNMLSRCLDQTNKSFHNYGGRGISVCEEWLTFDGFYADMGAPPPGMSLDRIDVDGGYSRANCRWATAPEQAANKRTTILFTHNGVTAPLKELCAREGVKYGTAWKRLKHGHHPFTPAVAA